MKATVLLLTICSPFMLMGQSESSENSVKKDNIIIDVYIGGPQLLSRLGTTNNSGDFSSTLTTKGFGPFGARVEYMLTPKSSLGFEVNYASSTLTSTWDDGYDKFSEELKITRTRFFPRYALHFGKKKLDAYWHIGLGVALWNIDLKTTDPSSTIYSASTTTRGTGPVVAFRTGVGLRYFFTDKFGLNVDFGLGGALFTGGITVKL